MKISIKRNSFLAVLSALLLSTAVFSQSSFSASASADFVSRYVWRGTLVNDAPNIQPALSVSYSGLSFGFWGSYALSKINKSEDDFGLSQEIDTWASYSYRFKNGMGFSTLITDYYFPQAGIKLGNFNNYDNPKGAGAHTLELGFSLSGNNSFPLSLSAFVNVYNDEGRNAYFELDYSSSVSEYNFDLFVGVAGGSKTNSAYYGTEKFNIINLGVKLQREIKLTNSFSIPLSVSYTINPKAEISYLIFGLSI